MGMETAPTNTIRTPDEVAAILGQSVQTLSRWRMRGNGPAYIKVGRKIWYSQAAIESFLTARTRTSTSQVAA